MNVVCYITSNGYLFTSAYILQDVGLKFELSCGFKSLGEMGLDKSSSSSAARVAQVGHHFMSVAIIK